MDKERYRIIYQEQAANCQQHTQLKESRLIGNIAEKGRVMITVPSVIQAGLISYVRHNSLL